MKDWTEEYVGLPWSKAGNGPTEYNCWNLVRKIKQEQQNIHLPEHNAITGEDFERYALKITRESGSEKWKRLQSPEAFCLVGMSLSQKFLHHVGLYLPEDGGVVLHCHESSGCIIEDVQSLKMKGWRRIEYYGYCN